MPIVPPRSFAGGWFHTGDQGFLDEQGYVTLTGRIKELINRGGEKVSPLEVKAALPGVPALLSLCTSGICAAFCTWACTWVDAALLSHPAVAEAVSFGAPDQKYGEVVAAAVVLRPGNITLLSDAEVASALGGRGMWVACSHVLRCGWHVLTALGCGWHVLMVLECGWRVLTALGAISQDTGLKAFCDLL
eukprot:scaffold15714_cov20-Tisochrysis_lutea.AAC.7